MTQPSRPCPTPRVPNGILNLIIWQFLLLLISIPAYAAVLLWTHGAGPPEIVTAGFGVEMLLWIFTWCYALIGYNRERSRR